MDHIIGERSIPSGACVIKETCSLQLIFYTKGSKLRTSSLGRLDRDYKPANSTLLNRGHDMMLRWIGGAGHLNINGTEYQLNQLHWHAPTEHTINGRRFNLELHLVHQSTDGKIAVVGIMYKIGRPDSLLSVMEPYFKALASTKDVEKSTKDVEKSVRTVSREQLHAIREAVHDDAEVNSRPVQPLNNRWLKLYRPDVQQNN
ncbi:bifunctional monodehydroascorbate reductase and carbonic anhydrase nectarin-3 [Artemisia annua]|uniref:Bifunctional monodehydroascorbate reductase and carbonic anhydrase nectarin-3 n=1 Tax=Artemisia annua TaxID=35608 RepID=A0A2U1KVG1_ARTAN|nr:bifunctional monodehydroascorbate reductase and carbonic anhydrase nectarin-3 [Artemisia annua]